MKILFKFQKTETSIYDDEEEQLRVESEIHAERLRARLEAEIETRKKLESQQLLERHLMIMTLYDFVYEKRIGGDIESAEGMVFQVRLAEFREGKFGDKRFAIKVHSQDSPRSNSFIYLSCISTTLQT